MATKTQTLKLRTLSAKYLYDLLQSTGWSRTTDDVIVSGYIVEERLPRRLGRVIPPDVVADTKKFDTWADVELSVELSDKQLEVAKYVIEKFAKDGKVPTNTYGGELAAALGFGSKLLRRPEAGSGHAVKLRRLSLKYLIDRLQGAVTLEDRRGGVSMWSWTRTAEDVVVAAAIQEEWLMPVLKAHPLTEDLASDPDQFDDWSSPEHEICLTEKQRDLCKFVIEKAAKDGKLPTNFGGACLARAFGYGEDLQEKEEPKKEAPRAKKKATAPASEPEPAAAPSA